MASKSPTPTPDAAAREATAGAATSRRLLLLRHAKASRDDPSAPDKERPLTDAGREAARALRRYMQAERLAPDLVLTSSSRRTLDTLQELKPLEGVAQIDARDDLYLASPSDMIEILHGVEEPTSCVLVIGHNPGIQELALLLVSGDRSKKSAKLLRRMAEFFPTCGFAELELDRGWPEIGYGSARLKRFLRPKDIAASA